ncbi:type II secretion system protein [Geminicoccaceae bacterium 1502E]|nr:type II secretion system protein [Geminicoccaceae bacterium 1502E]
MAERSRGFTLLETLVALVIVAIVIGGALRALGVGIRGSDRASRDLAMAQLAESVLQQARIDLREGRPGEPEGRRGELEWRLDLEPMEGAAEAGPQASRLVLLRATITGKGGDSLDFSTLALMGAET